MLQLNEDLIAKNKDLEEKITCLQKADIYILPSYNEGLPISILEAMAYGHPIISTNLKSSKIKSS